jgi:hypothetical protein
MKARISTRSVSRPAIAFVIAIGLVGTLAAFDIARGQDTTGSVPTLVTVDNFIRAESDHYFMPLGTQMLGALQHHREPMAIEDQVVIRPNRDTLYSMGVFDLDAGPVTVTMPEAGERFMSVQLISEDHFVPAVYYGGGTHTITKEQMGTRYGVLGIRILVDPEDEADVTEVHRLQDAIKIEQPGAPGTFEVPSWDEASLTKVREALLALADTLPNTKGMFGTRDEVDPIRHLIGTASAFGGNPEKDAFYLNVVPAQNDGAVVHRLHVPAEVPVEGFWSISL